MTAEERMASVRFSRWCVEKSKLDPWFPSPDVARSVIQAFLEDVGADYVENMDHYRRKEQALAVAVAKMAYQFDLQFTGREDI